MTIGLRFVDGGEAEVRETDGERLVIVSTRAAAPGQPLAAESNLQNAARVRLKVQGCRKEPDGRFRIHGRWLDLTRAAREEIVAAASGGT